MNIIIKSIINIVDKMQIKIKILNIYLLEVYLF